MIPVPSSVKRLPLLAALLGALLLVPRSAAAQEGAIAGQVVDASNAQPLSGVQVFLPDHDLGVLTGQDGQYRITGVPAGEVRVRARLIGYRQVGRTVQVTAGETTALDFELPVSAVSLQDVVVTATGQRERRELGNAVSTIDASETVQNQNPQTFSNLLQGNSPGVTIQQSSGSIGTASTLKIRGNSSIGLSQTPIVYVDGARINNNNTEGAEVGGQETSRLNDLSPEDIESVEVIKGPAAATLYGTEASAGVIRITTKQGAAGQPTRYTFRAQQGTTYDVTDWWSMAFNPQSFFGIGKDTIYTQSLMEGTRFGDPFRFGHLQTWAANIRGGTEGVGYYFSGEFRNDQGNMPANQVDNYNARANINVDPGEKVDISLSSSFISQFINLPENDNNLFGISSVALGSPWWGPITRPDPNTGGAPVETCMLAFEASRDFGAPLADVTSGDALGGDFACEPGLPFFGGNTFETIFTQFNEEQVERFIGSANFTWQPFDRFTARFTAGYDEANSSLDEIIPVDPERPFGDDSDGYIEKESRVERNISLEATSTLEIPVTDDFRTTTTVGAQWFDEITDWQQVIGREFPAGSPAVNNSVENEGDDFFVETKTIGVFVQEEFAWRDRLFVTPGVRFDDNSAFGENLGIQEYFQVNGSYVVSDEEWFTDFFDEFRLRAAWGESGKQPGSNDALFLLETNPVARGGTDVQGVSADQPGNQELKPERGSEWEGGFDATFLQSRLILEFTYYNQTTNDAIVPRELAPSVGFPEERFVNISEIKNEGIEVALNATAAEREDFRWDWRVNFSTNSNEITELPAPLNVPGDLAGIQQHREGLPFASYIDPVVSFEGGEVVVSDTAEFLGQPTPEWEGSVSTTMNFFRHISLFAQLDFQGGHQLLNATEELNCGLFTCIGLFERTEPGGELTERAQIVTEARRIGSISPYVSDADFAKLRTVSMRFDIPRNWIDFLGVQDLSLNLTGENLMSWDSYQGTDPEVNVAGSDDANRAQFLSLPVGRRLTGSLRVTF
jgi:TonB-linked SusC/RagA family outer membrane protein